MNGQKRNSNKLRVDRDWTLFLDRDGVINKQVEGDYVRSWEQFEFIPEFLVSAKTLSEKFGRIIVTTNQRCIGKKIITEGQLQAIHDKMLKEIETAGSAINKVYHCPHELEKDCDCRKPKKGMALKAQSDFKNIDFSKSIMIGDSESDMEFGKRMGMVTVFISDADSDYADYRYPDIHTFCMELI